jgi:hypothetical protein
MLTLTLSHRNARIERMKAQRSPSSGNAKHLQRKPPPPPASRVPKPEPVEANP